MLRRKATAAREVRQARAMTVARALRIALARAADDVTGTALAVATVAEDDTTTDGVVEGLADGELILLLDGPDGAAGAMSLSFAVASGLVEAQTTGRVGQRPPDPRPPTRTDAAILSPLVDTMMTRLEQAMGEHEAPVPLAGYRFGAMMENARLLGLSLDAPEYRRFELKVDLEGLRQGRIVLVLPSKLPEAAPPSVADPLAPDRADNPVLNDLPVQINAVLCRFSLTVDQLRRLAPGDTFPVPRNAIARSRLEAEPGVPLAEGRLGQLDGYRAIRLTLEVEGAEDAEEPAPFAPADIGAPEAGPARSAPPVTLPDPVAEPLPDLPEVPDLPDLPDLGDLPGFGNAEEEGEYDLPPLPRVSGLD